MQPFQLTKIIYEIYFAAEKLGYFKNCIGFNLESAISVIITFCWRVFDPRKQNSILLVEIKELLLILCKVNSIQNLMTELFDLVCNQNRCISFQKLRLLVAIFIKMLIEIGEEEAYGLHNMNEMMEQLYAMYPGALDVNESQFQYLWFDKGTRFIIYANLLVLTKRMHDTEKLIHKTQCAGCRIDQITGIRFECKKCKQLSLCMKCFAIGFVHKPHVSEHGMFEVFTNESSYQLKTNFFGFKKLCSALCFLREREDKVEKRESPGTENNVNFGLENEYISLIETVASKNYKIKKNRLGEDVIQQSDLVVALKILTNNFMDQKHELEKHISNLPSNSKKDFLISHQLFLEEIKNKIDLLIVSISTHTEK